MGSAENPLFSHSQSSSDDDYDACLYATQLASLLTLPMTLKAALELDLFEIISKAGPGAYLTPAEISSQLPTENQAAATAALDRMLRLLACYKVLTCSVEVGADGKVERKYGAAPVLKFLTRNEDGVSMAAMALLSLDKVNIKGWCHLKDAVLEGVIPFKKAHGMTTYEYQGTDPRFSQVFNEAMRNHSTITMKKMLEKYDGFDDVKVLIDVGGGTGGTIEMILKKYPHIKGINFDLPHVISKAPAIPGVDHVGGDMFESVPSGDAIFMKWILHCWSDEQCVKLLKNCWESLPPHGKVIVMDCIVPTNPAQPAAGSQVVIQLDTAMLMALPGAKERTEKEFEYLAKQAGFPGIRNKCSYANLWLLEFYK